MLNAVPAFAFGSKWATFLACLVGVLAGFDPAGALALPQQIFLAPAQLLLSATPTPARFDVLLVLAFFVWLAGFSLLRLRSQRH